MPEPSFEDQELNRGQGCYVAGEKSKADEEGKKQCPARRQAPSSPNVLIFEAQENGCGSATGNFMLQGLDGDLKHARTFPQHLLQTKGDSGKSPPNTVTSS